MDVSPADLLCLHLESLAPIEEGGPVRYERCAAGICDVVAGPGRDRLESLSTLDRLVAEGLLTESIRSVVGVDGDRTVYELTDAGRERARERRAELARESVRLRRDGAERTVRIERLEDVLDGERTVASALSALDDGVVDLGDSSPGERFVNRERELHILENALWESPDPPSGVVLVGGTGVGKSTLVTAFTDRVQESGGRVIRASADRNASETFGIFRSLVDSLDADAPSPFESVEHVDPTEINAEAYDGRRKALFADVLERLEDREHDRRTVLVLENLEWATPESLDLLSTLVDNVADASLRLVGCCTTDFVDEDGRLADVLEELTADETVERLEIEPLSREGVASYVRWLLGTDDLPSSFVDRVYERTEGNPLFVTALVRHLHDEGVVDPGEAVYDAADERTELPETVRTTVGRRLDSFTDEQLEILEAAAVVGQRVPLPVLARVTDRSESALRSITGAIVDSELWERVDDPSVPLTRTFRFRDPVIRDAVLERLEEPRRERLHERAAEAVLDVELTGEAATSATAARHYDRAGDEERALEHYRAAGDGAFEAFAHETALEYYDRGIALARSLGRQEVELDLLEAVADIERARGEYDAAKTGYRDVLERADAVQRRVRLLRKLADSYVRTAEYDRALALIEDGLELAEESAVPDEATTTLLLFEGNALVRARRFDEALEVLDRQVELADEIGSTAEKAKGTLMIGSTHLVSGDLERAEPHLREAVELTASEAMTKYCASAENNLGLLFERRNDLERALTRYERARDQHEKAGAVHEVALTTTNLGTLRMEVGQTERALEHFREARDAARRLGDENLLTNARNGIAVVHLRRGERDVCLRTAQSSLDGDGTSDLDQSTASTHNILAKAHYFGGDLENMREAVERQLEAAHGTDEKRWIAWGKMRRGTISRLEGDLEAAVDGHREAIAFATERGLGRVVLDARLELVLDYAAVGDAEAALEQADAIEDVANEHQTETVALARGIACRVAGRHLEAADALERARSESRERDRRLKAFRAREQQARVALARGDDERARDLAANLRERADERGVGLFVENADEILARVEKQ